MKGTNRSLISLFCLAIGLSLLACGLESVLYLNPPQPKPSTSKTFIFKKTEDNSESEFRGFELYYKLYPTQTTEDNLNSLDDLKINKFHRIMAESDLEDNISKPLIFIPVGDRVGTTFNITVDFSTLPSSPPKVLVTALTPQIDITILRGVPYNELPYLDQFKPFEKDAFENNDTDLVSGAYENIDKGDPVHLALYALSYGKKDLIFDVYSVAVFLGDIELRFD